MSRNALPVTAVEQEGDPFDSSFPSQHLHFAFCIWDLSALETGPTIGASHARFVEPRSKKEASIFFFTLPPLVDFFLVSEGKEYRYRYGASGSHRGYS